jgi:hypothetical protein
MTTILGTTLLPREGDFVSVGRHELPGWRGTPEIEFAEEVIPKIQASGAAAK